jgi:integrase
VLIPEFGDHALSELTAKHVRDWIDSHNLTQKRICNILTPLRQVMALALEDEKVDTNPLSTFKVKKRQVDEMRELDEDIVDPFTSDEINAILPTSIPRQPTMSSSVFGPG